MLDTEAEQARQERREWFDGYLQTTEGQTELTAAGIPGPWFTCPCCAYPTLSERNAWEICWICWWEDDGQDDGDANLVLGGPNQNLSLAQARKNFTQTQHNDPARKHLETARQTKARHDGIATYQKLLTAEPEECIELWKQAHQTETGCHHLSRAVTPEIRAEIERRAQAKAQLRQ